jgi:hypothetical protein
MTIFLYHFFCEVSEMARRNSKNSWSGFSGNLHRSSDDIEVGRFQGGRSPFLLTVLLLLAAFLAYLIFTVLSDTSKKGPPVEVVEKQLATPKADGKTQETRSQVESSNRPPVVVIVNNSQAVHPPAQIHLQASSNHNMLPTANCRVANLSQGSNWLDSDACLVVGMTVGASMSIFGIGTESPIKFISGAEFIIKANDQSSECDSSKTTDRCMRWITANQILGSDEGGGGKRRYWFWLVTRGPIVVFD